ncbi:3-methyl-2-oxobutanoate hydroxymethyltransferase [Entomobacter blattae]|uniref:3-methyl-2-oxobutanoate hydroxymethyltransferase n=1 Tax=Entomobacter blattae TaxID=2762277 RepID=A0A7H1NRB2_9PROT|nr:3-methyl-2-oxobutanoate hydroxymethyltransferase [Entomobacter blattae]QNT78322.1 3-methyl-2-oxobutanoate hydroxymethyltransferase [Entomobacter blattae]
MISYPISTPLSSATPIKRLTVPAIKAMKGTVPIVCLTAYTAPVARIVDEVTDLILVGDSVGMVLYGTDTTIGVSVEMMCAHGQAVVRASQRSCVVVDMPFGSYQKSPQQAFKTAVRILKATGAAAVKLEGGEEMADTVNFLTHRGVPVCGHVGLMPQSVQVMGGFKVTGRDRETAEKVCRDATAIAEAGAFAIVLEGVIEPVAAEITAQIAIPTIGIGASSACDGQVLVSDDIFGLFEGFKPKFVKRYAHIAEEMREAARQYAEEVRRREFPDQNHVFTPKT